MKKHNWFFFSYLTIFAGKCCFKTNIISTSLNVKAIAITENVEIGKVTFSCTSWTSLLTNVQNNLGNSLKCFNQLCFPCAAETLAMMKIFSRARNDSPQLSSFMRHKNNLWRAKCCEVVMILPVSKLFSSARFMF